MTTENRRLIDLNEILGFDFECHKCHSRKFIPLAEFVTQIGQCPHCSARWYPAEELFQESISRLASVIKNIKSLEKISEEVKVTFRVELSAEDNH